MKEHRSFEQSKLFTNGLHSTMLRGCRHLTGKVFLRARTLPRTVYVPWVGYGYVGRKYSLLDRPLDVVPDCHTYFGL